MNKLKRVYDSNDDIPEAARGLYEEKDGKWHLNVEIEGLTSSKRVEDFRTTNMRLKKKLEAYNDAEFGNGDMTPERVTELVTKEADFVAGNTKNKDEVQKLVDQRTEEMKKTFEREKKTLADKNADLTGKLQKVSVEAKAVEAAVPFGLKKTAHDDLINRVLKEFSVDENGDPVAYEADGRTPKYGANGEKLTVEEFVKRGATDKENGFVHLFNDSTGTHGDPTKQGLKGRESDNGSNPWDPKTFNRYEQGKILQTDPDKAQRMAEKHGHKLEISPADREAAAARRAGAL
jgi:hypothetical protein